MNVREETTNLSVELHKWRVQFGQKIENGRKFKEIANILISRTLETFTLPFRHAKRNWFIAQRISPVAEATMLSIIDWLGNFSESAYGWITDWALLRHCFINVAEHGLKLQSETWKLTMCAWKGYLYVPYVVDRITFPDVLRKQALGQI